MVELTQRCLSMMATTTTGLPLLLKSLPFLVLEPRGWVASVLQTERYKSEIACNPGRGPDEPICHVPSYSALLVSQYIVQSNPIVSMPQYLTCWGSREGAEARGSVDRPWLARLGLGEGEGEGDEGLSGQSKRLYRRDRPCNFVDTNTKRP